MFAKKTKILLLEDDLSTQELYGAILKKEGAEILSFTTSKAAINHCEASKLESEDIIITDLGLPDGDGADFVRYVRSIHKTIPILVISANEQLSVVIDVMRENVQDYLIKPIDRKKLVNKVQSILSRTEIDFSRWIYEKEKIISLEKLLDWYSFKNRAMEKGDFDKKTLHKNLFQTLRTSLSQGAGFGILMQIIDIIKAMEKDGKGHYLLQEEIVEILEENASYANRIVDTFSEIEDIIFDRVKTEPTEVQDIFVILDTAKMNLEDMLKNKDQTILIGKPDNRKYDQAKVLLNRTLFTKIITELLLNAMKFSAVGSKITILIYTEKDEISLSFINVMNSDNGVGEALPNELHNLLFEPFFRLNKNNYDAYKTLDFGLGLSFVREAITKFGGTVQVANLTDYSKDSKEAKVEFKIKLPYI
ncbi:histidine kinase [Leptospira kobayashii]|uniref:histidine kinase n=1 Tax=Leptospira kobayashii TaxID=1917830 RepID=A0ABN6KBR1_9LEPT|nr:response regulator [Leptospira kobayashii]BDA78403.1 histidine kinase [Leptospira kobayashii]